MLYFYHHVLHQDISQSNNFLIPIDNKSQDKYDFLIDLDYAVNVEANTLLCMSISVSHQTGILPYIAINILSNNHGLHFYHYNVESFLYMFIWSCIYDYNQRGYIPPTNAPDYRDCIMATKTLTVAHNVTHNAFLNSLV